jgi:phosphate transport system substrate-binding protein
MVLVCFLFITANVFSQAPDRIHDRDYYPFKGPKTASLGETPELRLKHNLPRLDGATAAYPVYAAIVQALYPRADYRDSKIIRLSTTPLAYEALVEGRADIIFCYAPSAEQEALAAAEGLEYSLTPVCADAFVFFVNKNNPVRNLTSFQIRGIYSGRITNWKELGGNDEEIIPYQRDPGSGSQTAFLKIMEGEPVMPPPLSRMILSMSGLVNRVADYENNAGAAGYSFRFFIQEMEENEEIALVSVDGVEPSSANIQNGRYPFTEILYAVTTGNESPNVRRLLDWIVSGQGQRLVAKTGYVPVKP